MNNNAQSTITAALTTASTSLTVQGGKGALFTSNQYATLYAAGVIELVLVGTISGDTLPITRAQGGTATAAWASGTMILQGANALTLNAAMQAGITNFQAGATMTGLATATFDPSADLHPVRRSWADANYYPASQPFQPALGYIPIEKGWAANAVSIGWSGTNPYLVIDGTYQGVIWHSGNYNPASKAAVGVNCNWNSGIAEFGAADPATPGPNGTNYATIDIGNPWIMEGLRLSSTHTYPRAVWLRNN